MSLTTMLHKLFSVDRQIYSLNERVENAQIHLNIQNRKLNELNEQRAALIAKAKKASGESAALETEAKAKEVRIETLREQMNQAKTNREYTAFLTELNTIKADKDNLESEVLTHLTKVDELNAEISEFDTQILDREKILKTAEIELAERRQAVGDRLAELQAEWDAAASDVPDSALATFREASRIHDGEAMAEIVEYDPRHLEYVCGACNMAVPVELFNNLLTQGSLTQCTSCARLLFVSADLRETFEKRVAK